MVAVVSVRDYVDCAGVCVCVWPSMFVGVIAI